MRPRGRKTMPVNSYKELRVFQNAMGACMEIFEVTKGFPSDERFSLVDQIRRSSRSVCANLGEAWRTRRHLAAFTAKLDTAAGEAGETQVWIEIAKRCGYLPGDVALRLDGTYEHITAQLISMSHSPQKWLIPSSAKVSDSNLVAAVASRVQTERTSRASQPVPATAR